MTLREMKKLWKGMESVTDEVNKGVFDVGVFLDTYWAPISEELGNMDQFLLGFTLEQNLARVTTLYGLVRSVSRVILPYNKEYDYASDDLDIMLGTLLSISNRLETLIGDSRSIRKQLRRIDKALS